MARERSRARDTSRQLWIDSGGTLTAKEIAEQTGVKPEQVRKWKSLDKWQADLEEAQSRRRRGGQPGNKNAAGAGAPYENRNAETHGAYSTVRLDELPPEQRAYIETLTLDTQRNMLHELQTLMAKEADLQEKIRKLEQGDTEALFVDKVVQMLVPRPRVRTEDGLETEDFKDVAEFEGADERYKTAMKTVIKASPFDRAMKIESELNRIHGRIIKLLDSIKAYEMESRRALLEERKYNLAKQKLTGAFDVDPETGEINDATEEIGDDIDI
jgi:uncharacterized protein YjcR